MADDKAIQSLHRIVDLSNTSTDARVEAALQLTIAGPVVPEPISRALNRLLSDGSLEAIDAIRLAVVRGGFCINVDEAVRLVAHLAMQSRSLPMSQAAEILAAYPLNTQPPLHEAVRDVLEIAGLVVADEQDGFMEVSDDALFAEALQAVLRSSQ